MAQFCLAVDACLSLRVVSLPVPVVLEVLHRPRSLQSLLGASVLDTPVFHPQMLYHLANAHVLHPAVDALVEALPLHGLALILEL